MAINLLVLSDNLRNVDAVSMTDYTTTSFASNVSQTLPYDNMMLNIATSTSGATFNNVMGTVSHGYSKFGLLIAIGLLLCFLFVAYKLIKRTY